MPEGSHLCDKSHGDGASNDDRSRPATSPLRRGFTAPIRFWSRWISPSTAPRCKYEPSCSRYATQAIEELGILRGSVLAAWRILRCNPWSHGGLDRVSDRTLFRSTDSQTDTKHRSTEPVHNP